MSNSITCEHCGHIHPFNGPIPVGRTATCAACKERFQVKEVVPPEAFVEAKPSKLSAVQDAALGAVDSAISLFFVAMFLILMLGVILSVLVMAENRPYAPERFQTDNAYGATANATEKLLLEVEQLRRMFGYFFVAWLIPYLWKAFRLLQPSITSSKPFVPSNPGGN